MSLCQFGSQNINKDSNNNLLEELLKILFFWYLERSTNRFISNLLSCDSQWQKKKTHTNTKIKIGSSYSLCSLSSHDSNVYVAVSDGLDNITTRSRDLHLFIVPLRLRRIIMWWAENEGSCGNSCERRESSVLCSCRQSFHIKLLATVSFISLQMSLV